MRSLVALIAWWVCATLCADAGESKALVAHDTAQRQVTISDASGALVLRLRNDQRCFLDQVLVGGRNVVSTNTGVCSGVKSGGQWFTTRQGIPTPSVRITNDTVVVAEIRYGPSGLQCQETWQFTALRDRILWRIDRQFAAGGVLEDTYFPGWDFAEMATWTGALLSHGGVAWCKLFDAPNATYGVHSGGMTLWNRQERQCLRINPRPVPGTHSATRFSRQPSGVFTVANYTAHERLQTKHALRRFLRDRQDVWAPWTVRTGDVTVEFTLQALDYEQAFDRGRLRHLNGASVREILHTIARIGAIDDEVMGSNGYYSGFAVLHEPWIAQLGLAINDPGYFDAYARTLDFQRDYAIGPDGRVKSRWSYDAGDAMPGTYDRNGFYECQWGWLMDSQPSYVINVADQFDFTGDREWLRRHQATCRRVLEYLLRRDRDADGLVEMMTASHQEARGSDWIDIIWASHENAFVNAQLYHALVRWAEAEQVLGDGDVAQGYRHQAAKLRDRFNAPTTQGGFWNASKRWYVYWRDKDDTIHGDNLVVPVNFMAIAYGLCEPEDRARGILDEVEKRMQQEKLFFWPLCFESYQPGEGAAWQYPFPVYENGDIFLAWGETGTRAYARLDPGIAVKYIRNVLDQYERDGLAFQRYLRKTQQGAGSDILANNCSPVVGLYRNVYGIQPKWNRLFLEPHLTPELSGTQLKYCLRGRTYDIDLDMAESRIAAEGFAVRARQPFAANLETATLQYFHGTNLTPSLDITPDKAAPAEVQIERWSDQPKGARRWSITCEAPNSVMKQTICQLAPAMTFRLLHNGVEVASLRSDSSGSVSFERRIDGSRPQRFELVP